MSAATLDLDTPTPAARGARTAIPRRKPVLGLSAASVAGYWFRGKKFPTRFCDALSLFFPEGERFFVESVHHFKDHIQDPALRAAVDDFIAQEAAHGRAHRSFNGALRDEGLPVTVELEARAKALLDLGRRILSAEGQLAVTCALEHYTAILAEQLLREPFIRDQMAPDVRALWIWHALEETEHKAVAFDVYQAVDGSYARRVAVMLLTSACFIGMTAYAHTRLMRADAAQPTEWADVLQGLNFMWGRPGMMRRLIPAYLEYFKPSFHPDDRDASALVAWGRQYLYGPGGLLEGQWPAESTS